MRKVLLLVALVYFSQNLFGLGGIANSRAGVYDLGHQYIEKLEQNPLDRDYRIEVRELSRSTRFSTQAWVELEAKYLALWDIELN